jgi:uncharacterized protein (DUF1330 family)
MKTNYKLALTLLAGIALGGAAIQGLHAQARPPAYIVADLNVTDQDGFAKNFAPMVEKIIVDGGGKYLAGGGKIVMIEGAPSNRFVMFVFPNLDQAVATFTSAAYKNVRKTGNPYANNFHILAVEGLPSQ